MKIVTASQMAALEAASERLGTGVGVLMEKAGLAVAQAVRTRLGGGVAGVKVAVLVGPGNNGSDGLVTARLLRRWGAEVTACLLTLRPGDDPKLDLAQDYGVRLLSLHPAAQDENSALSELDSVLRESRLVVDAVLGTGRSRPLDGWLKGVSVLLNAHRGAGTLTVLALDLPTGLDADTGRVDPACFTADLTVALGFPKIGHLTLPGAAAAGSLEVADIGLPAGVEDEPEIAPGLNLELLTREWVARQLPARPADSHKGTFGHALVVAGSRSYVGAAFLAAQAAVRVGAGLVTLATPRSVYPSAAAKLTEPIHLPLPEDEAGRIDPSAAASIKESDRSRGGYSAVLVGCGLGWSPGTVRFVEEFLLGERLNEPGGSWPVIIDADGLNNLSQSPDWWQRLTHEAVVTPHPGEMATLTGALAGDSTGVRGIQDDRVASAREWAARWGVAVTLKGAYTVVAEPSGIVRVSPFANPGLASGGTGDVLSGIIVGLMAQGLDPGRAAACGVYLHGLAGENAVQSRGNAGTTASDLVDLLPGTIREIKG
jgi:NAD(P)H-hydrate epimerase